MSNTQNVEFKTLDGLLLRGVLYPVSGRGAAVILTPGVSAHLISPQNLTYKMG